VCRGGVLRSSAAWSQGNSPEDPILRRFLSGFFSVCWRRKRSESESAMARERARGVFSSSGQGPGGVFALPLRGFSVAPQDAQGFSVAPQDAQGFSVLRKCPPPWAFSSVSVGFPLVYSASSFLEEKSGRRRRVGSRRERFSGCQRANVLRIVHARKRGQVSFRVEFFPSTVSLTLPLMVKNSSRRSIHCCALVATRAPAGDAPRDAAAPSARGRRPYTLQRRPLRCPEGKP
jgi:hypothetical protein